MSGLSPRVGLYLPGGGSLGLYGADEQVDIDKINQNSLLIDGALGIPKVSTLNRPKSPFIDQVIHNSTTDTWERWNGTQWVSAFPAAIDPVQFANTYYSKADLNGGSLDTRYFSQADLLTGKKLDGIYPAKSTPNTVGMSMLPFRAQFGSHLFTAADMAGGDSTFHVNFTSGRFPSAPVVATGINTQSKDVMHAGAQNIDTSGFDLYYARATAVQTTVYWIALGANT